MFQYSAFTWAAHKYYQRNQCSITLTIKTFNSIKALRVKIAMELLKVLD